MDMSSLKILFSIFIIDNALCKNVRIKSINQQASDSTILCFVNMIFF